MSRLHLNQRQIQILNAALKVNPKATKSERRIRNILLENSSSHDFEEARTEWIYTGTFYFEEDFGLFEPTCELCHSAGLKVNFLIENQIIGNTLRVGSSCIQNFLMLAGASSQSESQLKFRQQVADSIKFPAFRAAYKECLQPEPLKRHMADFHKRLRELLEERGMQWPRLSDSIDHIVEWIYGNGKRHLELDFFEQKRIRDLICNPSSVPVRTEVIKKDKFKVPTWQRKRTRVETSIAKSSAYSSWTHGGGRPTRLPQ